MLRCHGIGSFLSNQISLFGIGCSQRIKQVSTVMMVQILVFYVARLLKQGIVYFLNGPSLWLCGHHCWSLWWAKGYRGLELWVYLVMQSSKGNSLHKRIPKMALIRAIYSIWKERNCLACWTSSLRWSSDWKYYFFSKSSNGCLH